MIFISFVVKSGAQSSIGVRRLSRPIVYSYKLNAAVKTVDRRFSLLCDVQTSPVISVERIDGVNCL